jgi:hypothetical protein
MHVSAFAAIEDDRHIRDPLLQKLIREDALGMAGDRAPVDVPR